jgi:hypothetical protein
MSIPPDVDPLLFTPQPMDGEVESFEVKSCLFYALKGWTILIITKLASQDKLLQLLRSGLFKPNCGLGTFNDLCFKKGADFHIACSDHRLAHTTRLHHS